MTALASLFCDACGRHSPYADTKTLAAQTPGWACYDGGFHACPQCSKLPVTEFFDRVIERSITPPRRVARAITRIAARRA